VLTVTLSAHVSLLLLAEEEEEEATPKTKKETRWGWELLNDNKAIWLRNANDLDEEEYDKFFQAVSKVCHRTCTHQLSLPVRTQAQHQLVTSHNWSSM